MKVGIYDVYNGVKMPHQEIFKIILEYNNIEYEMVSIEDEKLWDRLEEYTMIIYKWPNNDNHHLLSQILIPIWENLGVNYYPNKATTWHYDDKVKQYYLLKAYGIEVVNSYVFFNKAKAIDFVKYTEMPVVAKLSKGASSSNVMLLRTKRQADRLINKAFSSKGISPQYFGSFNHLMKTLDYDIIQIIAHYLKRIKRRIEGRSSSLWARHKNYVFFQEYLIGNEYDTRVTTVGDRVHAFRRFNRKNDFRASGGEEWDLDTDKIDRRMLKIALGISKKLGFQTMAYDFIYDNNRDPKIVEISYLYGQPGYPDFMNGYWDKDLNWHEGRYWPQYFELVDALNRPDLKCPNIEVPDEWKKNTIL